MYAMFFKGKRCRILADYKYFCVIDNGRSGYHSDDITIIDKATKEVVKEYCSLSSGGSINTAKQYAFMLNNDRKKEVKE